MAKKAGRGYFITFEGPEGAGKTTHARLLGEKLRERGREVVYTREPGGTPFGDMIRKILLSHQYEEEIDRVTELILYEAIRAHHVENVIRPAIEAGKVVICDRFIDASMAYQGYGRGIPLAIVAALNRIASRGILPDVTILLDIPAERGLRIARDSHREEAAAGQLDRIESAGREFHRRVRNGYKAIAAREKKRFAVVARLKTVEATFASVIREVEKRAPGLLGPLGERIVRRAAPRRGLRGRRS